MNKTDLIELIAKGASISKVKAESAINITLETGKPIKIAARKVARFKPGKELIAAVK